MAGAEKTDELDTSDEEGLDDIETKTQKFIMPQGTILYHISPSENFVMDKEVYYFGEKLELCVRATMHRQRNKEDTDSLWLHVYETTESIKLLQENNRMWRLSVTYLHRYCERNGFDGWHMKVYDDNFKTFGLDKETRNWEDADYETALLKLDKVQGIGRKEFTIKDLRNSKTVILGRTIELVKELRF